MVQWSFTVDVLDDAYDSTEEDATLAEVPQRRFVNEVLLGKREVKVDQQVA